MVSRHIAARGIRDEATLAAMRAVPREHFVPAAFRHLAYQDSPLSIGLGQAISQPFIVALMTAALELEPEDRVLEIGAGSGYAAAVLGHIAAEVHTVERHPELAAQARERLTALGYDHVHVHVGDGTLGWPAAAPYQAIVATAAGPDVPQSLQEQLDVGGRLVMPVGPQRRSQELVQLTRVGADSFRRRSLEGVRFVPLVGAQGWAEARE